MSPDRTSPGSSLQSLVEDRWEGNGSAAEALDLIERHGASVTVTLLVCTHRRFERCARTLARRLAASGLLDADQLTEVADALLWEDRIAFAVPAHWVAGPALEGYRFRANGRPVVDPGSAEAEQTLPRRYRPPAAARRWAATWLLAQDTAAVEEILAWADRLPTGAGGAVVSGVLDAARSLRADQLEPALRHALAWPTSTVRRRALDVLADNGRVDQARDLAAGDTAADVRRWQPDADRRAAPAKHTLFELDG